MPVDVLIASFWTRVHRPPSPQMNLLDVLFPRRCLGCGRVGRYFCDKCRGTVRVIGQNETVCPVCERPSFVGITHARCKKDDTIDGLTSFFHYDGMIRQAVKALKYRCASDLAFEFIDLISAFSFPRATLVPIPLHPARLRFRGFNQAERLGKPIADKLSVRMMTDILTRSRRTKPQVEMKDKKERIKNMNGVFSIHNSSFSIPHSVLLFDDVFTTGATMRAAASVLKKAGSRFVWGLTMAR